MTKGTVSILPMRAKNRGLKSSRELDLKIVHQCSKLATEWDYQTWLLEIITDVEPEKIKIIKTSKLARWAFTKLVKILLRTKILKLVSTWCLLTKYRMKTFIQTDGILSLTRVDLPRKSTSIIKPTSWRKLLQLVSNLLKIWPCIKTIMWNKRKHEIASSNT